MLAVKVLAFDTGGTILDWHSGLVAALKECGALEHRLWRVAEIDHGPKRRRRRAAQCQGVLRAGAAKSRLADQRWGYMPVLAGLAVAKGAPEMSGALGLIDYLTRPETQIATARSVGFFPVVEAELPPDLEPGVKLAAAAIAKMQSAKDALPALLPIGLGQRGGEFDKVFMDTFQLIVLRGQKPRAVLDHEAETLNRLMTETGAPCWQPDPPSTGACQVQ
jgi:hypothetical protein